MMAANHNSGSESSLDARFVAFLRKVSAVASYEPRSRYLYPLMDGVPFCDLDVALDLALLNRAAEANDNKA